VTVSIGLTDALQDSAEAVLRRADMALYQAKRRGRNRVVLADKSDGDAAAAATPPHDAGTCALGNPVMDAVEPMIAVDPPARVDAVAAAVALAA
jgi:predicted signal transduction protein with EAL and GGDEF domain